MTTAADDTGLGSERSEPREWNLDDETIYRCRLCHALMVEALTHAATPDGKAICPDCWRLRIECGIPTGIHDVRRALALIREE